jgi:hypothetical protein
MDRDARGETMDRDARGEDVSREGSMDGHVERPERLQRAIATAALGAGAIATFAWIVFLGWAASEALAFKALKQWSHSSAKQVVVVSPKRARVGYGHPLVAEPVLAPARRWIRIQAKNLQANPG